MTNSPRWDPLAAEFLALISRMRACVLGRATHRRGRPKAGGHGLTSESAKSRITTPPRVPDFRDAQTAIGVRFRRCSFLVFRNTVVLGSCRTGRRKRCNRTRDLPHAALPCAQTPIITLNDRQATASHSDPPNARSWPQTLACYRDPNSTRSVVEIVITFAPLAALWTLAWVTIHFGYWWFALLLAVPAAGFLVRLFMIQHDCGHGSFFQNRRPNDWVGRVIGVVTLTPYDFWRRKSTVFPVANSRASWCI